MKIVRLNFRSHGFQPQAATGLHFRFRAATLKKREVRKAEQHFFCDFFIVTCGRVAQCCKKSQPQVQTKRLSEQSLWNWAVAT